MLRPNAGRLLKEVACPNGAVRPNDAGMAEGVVCVDGHASGAVCTGGGVIRGNKGADVDESPGVAVWLKGLNAFGELLALSKSAGGAPLNSNGILKMVLLGVVETHVGVLEGDKANWSRSDEAAVSEKVRGMR